MAIKDNAVYSAGRRLDRPGSLAETYRLLRECPDGLAWIGLCRPEEHEFASLAKEFDLHPLAVEDAVLAHQRPKIEPDAPASDFDGVEAPLAGPELRWHPPSTPAVTRRCCPCG